jgi:hypothetical protein
MAKLFPAAIFAVFFLCAGRAFAAGGTCPSGANYLSQSMDAQRLPLVTLASVGVTNCYYIASAGSDSNTGTDEGHPWAHFPGMPTCTANCASTTPAAGDGFIFRGGDTWGTSNFGMRWQWSGSATNPIYIGVDKAWSSGGAWTRPIWTCGGAYCSANDGWYFESNSSNFILDSIEFTGGYSNDNTGQYYVGGCGPNQVYENNYMHGWTHLAGMTTNPGGIGFATGCGTNTSGLTIRYNVVDGSDTSRDMFTAVRLSAPILYGNVFRYVVSGATACGDNWHDNLVEYLVSPPGGAHQDALYQYLQCYSANSLIYNNVIRNTTFAGSGGSVKLWFNGNGPCPFGSSASSCVGYAFGNVIYNNLPGNMVDTGGHLSGVFYGTWNFFNNTVQCGTDSDMGVCAVGMNTGATLNWYESNNHWIQSGTSSPLACTNNPGGNCSQTNDLLQTLAQANAQGYTSTSGDALEPTKATGGTVAAGANEQSHCTTIGSLNAAAGAACQKSTGYACAYNTSNHTVSCPATSEVLRPTSARWDVGAYQCIVEGDGGCAGQAPPVFDGGEPDASAVTSDGGELDATVVTSDGGAGELDAAWGSDAGSVGDPGNEGGGRDAGSSGGCGCYTARRRGHASGALWAIGLAGLLAVRRRRRA